MTLMSDFLHPYLFIMHDELIIFKLTDYLQ